jgi:hypothetical protein
VYYWAAGVVVVVVEESPDIGLLVVVVLEVEFVLLMSSATAPKATRAKREAAANKVFFMVNLQGGRLRRIQLKVTNPPVKQMYSSGHVTSNYK